MTIEVFNTSCVSLRLFLIELQNKQKIEINSNHFRVNILVFPNSKKTRWKIKTLPPQHTN